MNEKNTEYILEQLSRIDKKLQQNDTIDSVAIVARATSNSGQTINHNTFTAINYNATPIDTRAAVTTVPNWRFTAPVGGYYRVSAAVLIGVFAAGWAVGEAQHLWVYINGAQYAVLDAFYEASAGGGSLLTGSTDIPLSKGQYMEIFAYQFSGAALNLASDALYNWVSIHKIRGY